MLDLVRKGVLTGIGLASLTKDKVEELAEKIIEETKLSEEEGRKLVEDLLKQSEEARKNLEEEVKKTVGEAVEKLDIPSRKDLEDLKARIEKLEDQMSVDE
jgi:polyhydroxyalkanoate synthesis regulator phasin